MKSITLFLLASFFIATNVSANQHLVTIQSKNSFDETMNRLISTIKQKKLTLFNVIDHKKNAQSVDLSLRPTTLVIFGNPKVGTKLMRCSQQLGIELPLKVLVHKNEENDVFLTYTPPASLQHAYSLKGCEEVVKKVGKAMAAIANSAATSN